MSCKAIKRVAFLGKAPTSQHEIHWILQFADRLADRGEQESAAIPDNVIPFPEPRPKARKGTRCLYKGSGPL